MLTPTGGRAHTGPMQHLSGAITLVQPQIRIRFYSAFKAVTSDRFPAPLPE